MNYLTTTKVIGYLAFIFVAGGVTGSVITYKHSRAREVQPASMDKACTRIQDRLISKLALTSEQVKKLQPIFDQTALQLRAVHSRAICETDDIFKKAHEQIARELTPQQKVKLEQCDLQRREWLRHRLKEPTVKPEIQGPKPE